MLARRWRAPLAFVRAREAPLQLAALTAALLIGFELVLTHWFYLYIPWFFPFVAFALAPRAVRPADATRRVRRLELVAAGGRGRASPSSALPARVGRCSTGCYAATQIVDTPVYEHYGDAIEDGQVPYRDFRPEYPPGALPGFVAAGARQPRRGRLPRRVRVADGRVRRRARRAASRSRSRRSARRRRRTVAALAFAALSPLLLGSVVLTRFDLWPAALAVGALAALVCGRDRLGLGLLGAAVAAKLYPAVLVPLAVATSGGAAGAREALVGLRLSSRSSSPLLRARSSSSLRTASRTASAASSRGRCRSRASARRSSSRRTTSSGSTSR